MTIKPFHSRSTRRSRGHWAGAVLAICLGAPAPSLQSQLVTNLQLFSTRLKVGDPEVEAVQALEGPKGLATSDFNDDQFADLAACNTDGTVTVHLGQPGGRFAEPVHLQTGDQDLRGIVCGDLTGDGRPDIATAAPFSGKVYLFPNQSGAFGDPVPIVLWPGARNLAIGDFDGGGSRHLVVAGTTNGLRQLRFLGGVAFEDVTNLTSLAHTNLDFPKPVYTMESFRPDNATRDELVVTHADSDQVWLLAPNETGALEIRHTLAGARAHSLEVGPIFAEADSGLPDMILASRYDGTIQLHRGLDDASRFTQVPDQVLHVPGGPRALQIADLDQDGWNDLLVVLRYFDRVLTYHNSNGVLVAQTEMPVGTSPREIVSADYNQDGLPDVAVMNRDSMDVNVLNTYPGGASFSTFDLIYPVDTEVSGMQVLDFNKDGRDDVVQLHRVSGEFSVRLALETGLLGPPTFYPIGSLPSAQATVDVNNDGLVDMVSANMGVESQELGSVSVRLGLEGGGFGEEQRYYLPEETSGRLFALVAGDFNSDGFIDLAAGFFDCRLAFFQGDGQGGFTFTQAHFFVFESRVMVTGDFDQDGDLDLAGAGYAGDVVVIENTGDLLTTTTLTRYDYPRSSGKKFGTRDIVSADINDDGDPDLLVGSGDGAMLFLGAEGMQFFKVADKLPGTEFPASSVAVGDFDGDGTRDVAVSCRILSCITLLSQDEEGLYQPSVSFDVPSGSFLAVGDLDGDGQDDLVGSGSVLWTALSSRAAQAVQVTRLVVERPSMNQMVINELLAVNNALPLVQDENRTTDWLEIYNGGETSLAMIGWSLRLSYPDGTNGWGTNEFAMPPTAFLPAKSHLLILFSNERRSLYHTGFRMPGQGGVLSLFDPQGERVDRVAYPPQQENVSYGRYRDGAATFSANPFPSPMRPNVDNGSVEPTVNVEGVDFNTLQPGEPIRFFVHGRDDVGIVGVTLVYQRLDQPNPQPQRILLFDDGQNGDGGVLDGVFSGLIDPLPLGAEIQFYLEAVDLSGQTVILPDDPVFALPGQPLRLFSLSVGFSIPGLEISEVLAWNTNGIQDESGAFADWIEVRNCSDQPVSLRGVGLSQRLFADRARYQFGDDAWLEPGEHRIVFSDSDPEEGPNHAPFSMNRDGDELVLSGATLTGARIFLQHVAFGPQQADVALARLGCGGEWRAQASTPNSMNVSGAWQGWVDADRSRFTLAFPTQPDRIYQLDHADDLTSGEWTSMGSVMGDGIEHVIESPLGPMGFFRITTIEP